MVLDPEDQEDPLAKALMRNAPIPPTAQTPTTRQAALDHHDHLFLLTEACLAVPALVDHPCKAGDVHLQTCDRHLERAPHKNTLEEGMAVLPEPDLDPAVLALALGGHLVHH